VPRLRGAIVGFGNVAERGHWPGLAESADLEIIAVVDPAPGRRQAATARSGGIATYESVEDLAASERLDFIDIATPPSSHAALAKFGLARGWHVLCEKPLTLDPGCFEQLAATARACGRVLFTMHNWKAAPIFRAALDIVRSGRIGVVGHVELLVSRRQPCRGAADGSAGQAAREAADWRQDRSVAGGGILVDHGWHNFYLLLGLAGAEPQRISCTLQRPSNDPDALDHTARALVTFPSSTGYLHLTWNAAARRNAVMVHGGEGVLLLDDDRLVVVARGSRPEETLFPSALSAGSHHDDWFRAVFPQFVAEVRNPAARGANLREAAWCVTLIDAAYRSAEQGGRDVQLERRTENVERRT
jgi:predicted dehydrogenase